MAKNKTDCPVCGKGLKNVKIHWGHNHDEYIPRPWWPDPMDAKRGGGRYQWARRQVLERDDHTCQYCNRESSSDVHLVAHHITPFKRFGIPGRAHAPRNLVTLCSDCHNYVGQLPPSLQRNLFGQPPRRPLQGYRVGSNISGDLETVVEFMAQKEHEGFTLGYLNDSLEIDRITLKQLLTLLENNGYVELLHEPTALWRLVTDPRTEDQDGE